MTRDAGAASLDRRMLPAETPIHRLSVEDVQCMVKSGVLREEDRVELVDGVLVDVSPPGSEHSAIVAWLTRHFVGAVGEREVRVQDLLLVGDGFLMPDLMVIDGLPRDRQPTTAALVIEVAVTSQRYDAAKALRYAGASVPEYWIVDASTRAVDVHRVPSATGYADVRRYNQRERIAAAVAAATPVDVSALLP